MTFLEIVNEVLFDRFSETRRASIKRYVNARYGRVWAQEAWSFKRVIEQAVITAGSSSVSLATLGLQRIESVWRASSNVFFDINSVAPEEFYDWANTVGGTPYGFTVIADVLTLERSPSSDTTIWILGEKRFESLVDDGDPPLLPEEFHMMLVHGAASEALRMENDPTWQGFEQDYVAYLQDLKSGYLSSVRAYGGSYPAFNP